MSKNSILRAGFGILLAVAMLAGLLPTLVMPRTAMAATTSVNIVKYAADGTTVLAQTSRTYQQMRDGMTVLGDGTTHYYHQGPVFVDDADPATEETLRWNATENTNVLEKDMGAVRGTNIKDLCDLVGGMSPGDELKVKSSDGWNMAFAYKNVYEYSSREGPMVLTWQKDGQYPDTGYATGMRLVWFADTSVNPWGVHAFGNWDWHEAADPQYWYYNYGNQGEKYPTTTGLSAQVVSDILIYSDEPAPVAPVAAFIADKVSGVAPLTVQFTDQSTNIPTSWSWDFNNDGTPDSTAQNPSHTYSAAGTYTVKLTVSNSAGSDDEAKADYITVTAPAMDVLYNGTVVLTAGATFDKLAYKVSGSASYTVGQTTAMGALDAAAAAGGFTYDVTDKRYATYGVLLLDNIGSYLYVKGGSAWYAYVNDVYKDGYADSASALNVLQLSDGDRVEFYYAAGVVNAADLAAVKAAATAAVLTEATIEQPPPPPAAPVADFTTDKTSGVAPLTVQFTDQSANTPTSWSWDFENDGTVDSTVQNPTHTYTAGTYTVKLAVSNGTGSDEEVKTDYITVTEPTMDVLYNGTVVLTPDTTFQAVAYNSSQSYSIDRTTPLGALDVAAAAAGFTYGFTDKKFADNGTLLLDNVDTYMRKSPGYWYGYVNDVYRDGYLNAADALNVLQLADGDKVEFFYAAGITVPADLVAVKSAATAAVLTVASITVTPADWTLQLSGARAETVTKAFFEQGLACPSSGHYVEWTDSEGNVWGGVPLWLLVAMVDDDPDVGPDHFNFNDDLASQGYEVNVVAGDNWTATLDSSAIARSDGYIVANTLNGQPLPLLTQSGKPCWPLYLKGSEIFGGQQVGNIVRIELSGLPQPREGWTLDLQGELGYSVTQIEFEAGLACPSSGHLVEWTDLDGNVWSGVPLWLLLGMVDDNETSSHWTFNDDVAAAGYSVVVTAFDNFSRTFSSAKVARSNDYVVANRMNGQELADSWPLRLVGPGVTRADGSLGGAAVGKIVRIEIPELQTPPAAPGSWNLALTGKITDVVSEDEFEAALACPDGKHYVEWTDLDGNVWSGMPLWFLAGWVDDTMPHDFNTNQAMAGYKVLVRAGDGYTKEFASADVAWSNDYIVANAVNGQPLDESWPLRLVGAGVTRPDGTLGGASVGEIAEIELTEFQTVLPVPEVQVIKYAGDGTTILQQTTVDYQWMQQNLDVVGDGATVYRYEGVTNDPADVWDAAETYPGGYKIENAVMGTRIKDLCDLVGGMGSGTEIILVASDGYETILPYSCIYTNPAVQARQGDAILAWYADGQYVPYYADGMRLFFAPEGDHVYGQWDMHETLAENYWHYYWSGGVQYPSCAGLSNKNVVTIKVYSTPEADWTLQLDGTQIGGLKYEVSKTYFEQALACQFGAEHKATYTDAKGRVWEGMPLWFLAGFVDDTDQHSSNSFNDALAATGYLVVIRAGDGSVVTLSSRDMARNSNFIVANSLNGAHIPDTDDSWPLRLVGPAVSGSLSIKGIASIELLPAPVITATADANGSISPSGEVAVPYGTDQSFTISANQGYHILDVAVDGDSQGAIDAYTFSGVTENHTIVASFGVTVVSPAADFSATPTTGTAPLNVDFSHLCTGSEPLAFAWDFDNDGSVESTSPNPSHTFAVAGNYTVRLTVTNAAGSDYELKTEYITVNPAPLASIRVTSPNGGQRWAIGSLRTVTWTSRNVTGRVQIELSRDGGTAWETISASTPNDGRFAWRVTGPPTNRARVRVTSLSAGVSDTSNFSFAVTGRPSPSITVTSPNGGQWWVAGSSRAITWTSSGLTGRVRIQVSRDGGATWRTIVASTPNDGRYVWRVTGPATHRARIRVTSLSTGVSDASDYSFAIH